MPSVDPISEAPTEWPWLQFASWSDRHAFTRVLCANNISSHVHIGLLFTDCRNNSSPKNTPHTPEPIELCSLGRYNNTTRKPACVTTNAQPEEPFLPIQISHVPCYECRTEDLRWLSEVHWGSCIHWKWAREGVMKGSSWVDPFRRGEEVGIKARNEMVRIFRGLARSLDTGSDE